MKKVACWEALKVEKMAELWAALWAAQRVAYLVALWVVLLAVGMADETVDLTVAQKAVLKGFYLVARKAVMKDSL